MSANHHIKTFEEFLAEDLHHTISIDEEEEELDDSEVPDLPEDLTDGKKRRPLNRFLIDDDLESEDEEGEPAPY